MNRNSEQPEVLITGVGMLTPLGASFPETWERLLAGESAGQWLEFPDLPGKPRWPGCPARWPVDYLRPASWSEERLFLLGQLAAAEAVHDARGIDHVPPERRAVVVGTSKVDVAPLSEPMPWPDTFFPSRIASGVALTWDCQAAALCPVAACATGLVSILRGADMIRTGLADIVLVGGADASLHPTLLASYQRLGVMAKVESDPACACRPFDVDRHGFLVGEGGAILVLERGDLAQARGASRYGSIVGGGIANDPAGLTAVDGTGEALARCIRRVLAQSGVSPSDIDAVSLHGTGTRLNDQAEARALKLVWGDRVRQIPAYSTKGATGHLMGAAGAVETGLLLQGMKSGVIPPTTHLVTPDPEFQLCLASYPRELSCRLTLKVSMGFGGHLAVALFQS